MKRINMLIMAGCALCLAAGVTLYMTMLKPERKSAPSEMQQDLARHPFYSKYRFSAPEGVVRIGIQPFWVYGANIAEAMRRDRLLRRDLAKLGLRAEFHSFLKGPDINFFMEKGHLDVGMSGYLPTLQMTTLKDILVPATIDRNFFDLVGVNSFTFKELEGRRIGFPPGSDGHHALVEALDLTGIKAKLVPTEINEMPEAMRAGRIDACMAWDPVTSTILSENENARVVYRSLWVTFLSFRGEFTKTHPRAVRFLLSSQARAIRWLNAKPENIALSSRWAIDACRALAPDSPPFSLADFIRKSSAAAALSGEPVVSDVDLDDGQYLFHAFAFLKKERMVPADAEWQKTRAMFDTNLMRTILGEPVRWRLDKFDYDAREEQP